jgi:hypothetical protein
MKRLLYVSIPFLMMACGTSEDTMKSTTDITLDSTFVMTDSSTTIVDSLTVDLPLTDSGSPIIHGSQDQEMLDSIKNSKKDKKKKR